MLATHVATYVHSPHKEKTEAMLIAKDLNIFLVERNTILEIFLLKNLYFFNQSL